VGRSKVNAFRIGSIFAHNDAKRKKIVLISLGSKFQPLGGKFGITPSKLKLTGFARRVVCCV
jgi:hypothetical protein